MNFLTTFVFVALVIQIISIALLGICLGFQALQRVFLRLVSSNGKGSGH